MRRRNTKRLMMLVAVTGLTAVPVRLPACLPLPAPPKDPAPGGDSGTTYDNPGDDTPVPMPAPSPVVGASTDELPGGG